MTSELTKAKEILALPPEKRLHYILNSKDAEAIVHSMPEEEVWLTIKKVDPHDALPMLALASPDQLQYIMDLELWKRDKFLPAQSLEWLSLLKECGEKKILQWAYEADADSVILTFKEFIHIMKKESTEDNPPEKEWPGEIPPMTPDGVYYFQPLSQRADEVARPILELIARDNYNFFAKLCEAVMAELRSNLEETAFSWRMKRLAEKGFVPLEEALEVYKYLNDRQIASLPKRTGFKLADEEKRAFYPLALGGESYPVLMLALSDLKNDPFMEDAAKEIAVLANNVIMADARLISPEVIEACVKKVMGYVNIGLEHLSGADPHRAGNILRERWLKHLFQIGFSLISRLRQHARKFIASGWPSKIGGDLSLLEEKLSSRIEGALRKRPQYFGMESAENPYREFKSLDEVREVERNIEYAEYTGRMFMSVFDLSPAEVKKIAAERDDMRWSNVLLTIWAKGTATGQYKFSPLSERELETVLRKTFGSDSMESSLRSFRMETSAMFAHWLIGRQPHISSDEERHCRTFVDECFNKFLDEFGEMSGRHPIDWRFVQSIWVIPKAD